MESAWLSASVQKPTPPARPEQNFVKDSGITVLDVTDGLERNFDSV
jgi:hypothetical protein